MALNKCYVILSWHPFFPPASPRCFFFPMPNTELEKESGWERILGKGRGRFSSWKGWCFCVSVVGKPNELSISHQGEVTCYDSSCWNSSAVPQTAVPTLRPCLQSSKAAQPWFWSTGGRGAGEKPGMLMSWAGLAQGAGSAAASCAEGVRVTQHGLGYPPLAAATSSISWAVHAV